MMVIDRGGSNRDSGNTPRLTNDRQLQLEQDFYDERWKNYGKPEHDRGRIELTSESHSRMPDAETDAFLKLYGRTVTVFSGVLILSIAVCVDTVDEDAADQLPDQGSRWTFL